MLDLTTTRQIIVKRKHEFFDAPEGSETAHQLYVATEASRCLKIWSTEDIDKWRLVQTATLHLRQFGSIRVLLLSRSSGVTWNIWKHCTECFDAIEPVFTFIPAHTIEEAHNILIDHPIEMVLAVPDRDSKDCWFPLIGELLLERAPFGIICAVFPERDKPKLPPHVMPFPLGEGSSFLPRDLVTTMLLSVKGYCQ